MLAARKLPAGENVDCFFNQISGACPWASQPGPVTTRNPPKDQCSRLAARVADMSLNGEGSTDALGGAAPNGRILAGSERAVQRGNP